MGRRATKWPPSPGRTAAHTGRENGLDLVRRHRGAVVVDRYQHSAVAPLDVYVYASAGERTGVLYQRLQHAHGDLGLDAESTWRNEVVVTVEVSAPGYAPAAAEVTKAVGTGEKAGE